VIHWIINWLVTTVCILALCLLYHV
jgi:hypothetical protein